MTTTSAPRNIVHFDLDTFFVSVERLRDSRLMGKPVLIGGISDRSVVASCSYEARKYGIHSAMPMRMARRLCSDAIIIRGDMDMYSKYSRMVTNIIADSAPVYEKASIDEHYLDLSGMERFFGVSKWSHELRERIIRETGLPISMGLSVNKTVSKIATGEAKPNGELVISGNAVNTFLGPLSIRKIPGVGDKTYRLLRAMGVSDIHTLALIPPDMILRVLGQNGLDIWRKANGIDLTPVQAYTEQKSMSTERTFEEDTIDVKKLERILSGMSEHLAYELRKSQRVTGNVAVKIRYANFDTHTTQQRIEYTSLDHKLTPLVLQLFKKLYNRRLLIRLVGVRFSNLVYGAPQLNLFEDTSEMVRLYQAIDQIKNKYGAHSIGKALSFRYDQNPEEQRGTYNFYKPTD